MNSSHSITLWFRNVYYLHFQKQVNSLHLKCYCKNAFTLITLNFAAANILLTENILASFVRIKIWPKLKQHKKLLCSVTTKPKKTRPTASTKNPKPHTLKIPEAPFQKHLLSKTWQEFLKILLNTWNIKLLLKQFVNVLC